MFSPLIGEEHLSSPYSASWPLQVKTHSLGHKKKLETSRDFSRWAEIKSAWCLSGESRLV
jgi:hypothetical protein